MLYQLCLIYCKLTLVYTLKHTSNYVFMFNLIRFTIFIMLIVVNNFHQLHLFLFYFYSSFICLEISTQWESCLSSFGFSSRTPPSLESKREFR